MIGPESDVRVDRPHPCAAVGIDPDDDLVVGSDIEPLPRGDETLVDDLKPIAAVVGRVRARECGRALRGTSRPRRCRGGRLPIRDNVTADAALLDECPAVDVAPVPRYTASQSPTIATWSARPRAGKLSDLEDERVGTIVERRRGRRGSRRGTSPRAVTRASATATARFATTPYAASSPTPAMARARLSPRASVSTAGRPWRMPRSCRRRATEGSRRCSGT